MLVFAVISIALAVFLLLIGLMVLVRNHQDPINRNFFTMCLLGVVWSLSFEWTFYLFTSQPADSSMLALDIFNRASYVLGLLLLLSMVIFTFIFPKKRKTTVLRAVVPLYIITAILSTSELIAGVTGVENGEYVIKTGEYIWIYLTTILVGIGIIVYNLFYQRRIAISPAQRSQNRLLATGLVSSIFIAFLLATVSPILFPSLKIDLISPIALLFFLIPVGSAIVKHKLFNVRLIVARALGYALSLGALISIYALIIFIVTQRIFERAGPIITDQVVPLAAAIILGLSYPKSKKFFDRQTNKIFYRDSYDPQTFLDELNSTIAGNIELGILLRHTTSVMQKNLKSEHCFIEVLPTSDSQSRVFGVGTLQLDRDESQFILKTLADSGKRTIVTDHLGSNEEKLRNTLSDRNIGLISRIVPRQGSKQKAIAHLIIGQKKSGNIYDKQDIKIVEIISDELLIAIQNALRFEEIQLFNVTLQAKVNEATAKLQKTNKKLRDLDETKDEFISMASHQLRTPLTTIKGYMSMVLEGDAGKLTKPQEELLQQAFISSQRMVFLIADLLNVSRLKSGKFVLDLKPTNLAEVVQGEITQLKETAKAKGLGFEFKKPAKFPELMLDETKIRQVIMNFSDNAIYYTPSGGKITIELKEDKNSVYFTVKDTGLGVPKDEKAHMFTKFYRAKNARNARPDGTGLGLFMAKKVVDVLGGNIIFESEEGKGSTFGFTFEKRKHLTDQSAE